MYVKLDEGLTQPFVTTTGFKQGCVFSPILFNLYINKLPTVYDEKCDPVFIGTRPIHSLMWADDCVLRGDVHLPGRAAEGHQQDSGVLRQAGSDCEHQEDQVRHLQPHWLESKEVSKN